MNCTSAIIGIRKHNSSMLNANTTTSAVSNQQALAPNIVLCTLNAKYIHASLGLRYLLANMPHYASQELAHSTRIVEFTLSRKIKDMSQELLTLLGPPKTGQTQVIGFGVYIWNVVQTTALIRELKASRPQLKIVLGGPEVSHETSTQEIVELSDHVITGWGDVSFPKLCKALIEGPQPLMKIIPGEQPPLNEIAMPYENFTPEDLAHRVLYVEASRGCPFKCEFCLSSLDKTAWSFDTPRFLSALEKLFDQGARNFKFVDRTFNLKIETSLQILQFFLDRLHLQGDTPLFVHFEVIPDHLPPRLKQAIAQFPPGVLQFEVGIQTFNEQVQQLISRRQDNEQTQANLRWLLESSHAYLHTDLIFGLPGESMESFAAGFDRLVDIGPHEIQLGILKRLRGTPISRHTEAFQMVYDENPPYAVRQTQLLSTHDIERFSRMAKFWDLVANSARFKQTLALILEPRVPKYSKFWSFMDFSDTLWLSLGRSHGLSPEELVDAVFDYLTRCVGLEQAKVRESLRQDYEGSGAKGSPHCLLEVRSTQKMRRAEIIQKILTHQKSDSLKPVSGLTQRQRRHVR